MEKASERRAEQRLCYRWPVRLARNTKEKPFSGQMVNVSSKGVALLCHADKNCPQPGQMIIANFGVPHFDLHDSFDTVVFNRTGRVCRVDSLSKQVHRVAIQFAEPLFFKPGEQNISESDAQQRLKAKAQSIIKTRGKDRADVEALTRAQEKAKAYREALARAEERIRSYAEAKAEAEEKLRAEIEARYRTEAESVAEAEEKIRAYAEAKAIAEEKAKTEARARAKAEAKVKAEAKLRAKAEKKAGTEAEKRAKVEAEAQAKAISYADQINKIKAEAEQEIANVKAEAADKIAKVKAEFKAKTRSYDEAKIRDEEKENTQDKAKPSGEGGLMKKVDKFITDRDRIF